MAKPPNTPSILLVEDDPLLRHAFRLLLEDAGYTDLLELFVGPDAYTYVFDGQLGYLDYARAFFANPSRFTDVYGEPTGDMLEGFDLCREMCFRVAWTPYMFSHTLPHLLEGVPAEVLSDPQHERTQAFLSKVL